MPCHAMPTNDEMNAAKCELRNSLYHIDKRRDESHVEQSLDGFEEMAKVMHCATITYSTKQNKKHSQKSV